MAKAKPISQLTPDLTKVLDVMMHRFASRISNRLQTPALVPFDTGNYVNSWEPKQFKQLDYTDEYRMTNDVPYAATITFDGNYPPSWGGQNRLKSAAPDWFFVMMKSLEPDLKAALKYAESQL